MNHFSSLTSDLKGLILTEVTLPVVAKGIGSPSSFFSLSSTWRGKGVTQMEAPSPRLIGPWSNLGLDSGARGSRGRCRTKVERMSDPQMSNKILNFWFAAWCQWSLTMIIFLQCPHRQTDFVSNSLRMHGRTLTRRSSGLFTKHLWTSSTSPSIGWYFCRMVLSHESLSLNSTKAKPRFERTITSWYQKRYYWVSLL